MNIMIAFFAGGLLFAMIFRIIYTQKERNLLERLEHMMEEASDGRFEISAYTEEELSLVENQLKHLIERSSLSENVQKAQKERIQQLISDIAHQTLTPISNLRLYSDLLNEKHEGDAMVSAISEETEKLNFLISSLVKVSRMENGIISVHPSLISTKLLTNALFDAYNQRAKATKLSFFAEESDLPIVCDLKWTVEALSNIVDNAIKYTPEGGTIRISCEAYSFYTKITISDTGIGISEEEIPKIFARFYRSVDVSDEAGVGIGLYLARSIIELQKGYIRVSSQKGSGSAFSVFLPCGKKYQN